MEVTLPYYTSLGYNTSMIPRNAAKEILQIARDYPVVTVLGPRQSGKSTLVLDSFPNRKYVNLELPDIQQSITNDPRSFLDSIPGEGVIIDEVQRMPELLSYIQAYVDKHKVNGQFILTGSHQLELHEAITQSLAGRVGIIKLLPLSIQELKQSGRLEEESTDALMLKGFFPKLAANNIKASTYYQNYLATYVERDVRKMLNIRDLGLFQDFLRLLAGRTGQILNSASLGNELGISNHTVNNWLSILEASYITIRLRPYYENFGKRIIKQPKIYFTDTGLLCHLLGIELNSQLQRDPLRGQIFENLVVIELFKHQYNIGKEANFYFFRDSYGNEIDVIYKQANNLIPIEIKVAKTFHKNFLKSIKFLKKLQSGRVTYGFLIYSGEQLHAIEMIKIINFMDVEEVFTI